MTESKRLDLKTGFICNNNCLFCVQADNKCQGNRTTEELKRDLEDSRKRCDEVVFTGGEPTIRKDIFELVRYAKKLGYRAIHLQTNGRMLSSLDFCRKLIQSGVNVFNPAVHGHNAELHDSLTMAPGSFNQTIKGIKNLKSLNQIVVTNTVVVKQNYKYLEEIAKLLVSLGVDQFQLAFVHPMGRAYKNFDLVVPKISEVSSFIKTGLDVGIKAKISIMVEAMPYCLMDGYENYISEKIIPFTEIRGKEFQNTSDFGFIRKKYGKTKFPQCKSCKYNNVCEGPWKEYAEKFGSEEFKAIN